jgi:hypothetical protein
MSYHVADFQGQIALTAMIHHFYPNRAAELTAIATALGTDTTTHDTTITTAPVAVRPGNASHSSFTNDILLLVNAGKGGNLTAAQMATAINNVLGSVSPPANTTAPVVSGTGTVGQTLSCTQGTWTNGPTSYARQWLRGGTNIPGATAATYVLVAADGGTNVSCRVTATNAAGSTPATSNAIAVQGVPVNSVAPAATGTGAVGNTLTTTNGTWSNAPTSYAYQWLRGAATIAAATAATYVLQAADSGTNVSCRVTATNAAGASAPSTSNAIAVA